MNQKTIIAILGVVVVILIGTTVYFATINKVGAPVAPAPKVVQPTTPTQPVTTRQPTTQPVDETASWQTYSNEKFGFTLQFPKSWAGYEAGTEKESPTYDNVTGFTFKNEHQPFIIFAVNKYTKQQWDLAKNGSTQKILSQSNDLVITCDGCCDSNGDFTGGGQFDRFQVERCKEVPQILSTFKLTK